ncbi:glycerophosphodiester phosphodiesterase [Brevibacterium sp. 5221]|uniref:Glycerophosphodiester phosphodiesterase n=1 Tax=Brevibacterium rongguiense TaxID=2695267 RepID=A0A6N9H8Z7_9MICO|nr:glycerophosphodiester phosphodiesterase [Brevibacterium rongguiense]MYM19972.1 glycerophosphodiester phosphodiesterase [Brevibacterium rongguiense]
MIADFTADRRATRRGFLAGAAGAILGGLSFLASQEPAAAAGMRTATAVSALRGPTIFSHRGGALRYAEESMAGFVASAEAGFCPEMDIQFLADGAPVLCHDSTADRTMIGVSGPIDALTSAQWAAATIRNPFGAPQPAVFFAEVLDRLAATTTLVPEIKTGCSSSDVDRVIAMIKQHGAAASVLVQSFDYAICQRVQRAGIPTLYLIQGSVPAGLVARLKNDRIGWLGPSRATPLAQLEAVIAAGIKVAPYTVKSPEEVTRLPKGVAAYFADDPWTAQTRTPAAVSPKPDPAPKPQPKPKPKPKPKAKAKPKPKPVKSKRKASKAAKKHKNRKKRHTARRPKKRAGTLGGS